MGIFISGDEERVKFGKGLGDYIEMIRENKKLPADVKERLPDVVSAMSGMDDVAALYLFGGLAENDVKPLSDLDFGILLSRKLDQGTRLSRHLDLIGLFVDILKTDEIDLVLMNDAPLKIAYEILKTGKLLYCNNEIELINFFEETVKYYLDFKFFRDNFDAVFLKGIGAHG